MFKFIKAKTSSFIYFFFLAGPCNLSDGKEVQKREGICFIWLIHLLYNRK